MSVTDLEQVLQGKRAEVKDFLAQGIKVEGKNVVVSADDAKKARSLLGEIDEIKGYIALEEFGNGRTPNSFQGDGSYAVRMGAQGEALKDSMDGKSLGHAFVDSQEFKDFAQQGGYTMRSDFSIETYDLVRRAEAKDIYSSLNSHNIGVGIGTRVQFDPMVPRGQRLNRVRDLFPTATTANNLIDFFRVMGFNENGGNGNAGMVADRSGGAFALKPQSTLNFQPAQAPVRTIAHWEAAHRNIIQDVPQLQATINNELLYGLALVEDFQILFGDGSGENLLGVMNTPGIQVFTGNGTDPKADQLRKAQTLAIIANYPPTGYVVHPNDWEDIELDKGTTNDHYRIVTNIAVGAESRVWRLPVIETPAMTEGQFLTGAFGTGAQLYDRQQANVRIAEQHADFFVRNAIVILVEERLALATKRPESFVKGTY